MGLAEELQDETAEVLSSLIRFKTVNPPGNERECLEWLAGYLEDAGLTVELDGAESERPNLVATLRTGDGPALGYLSHVDTVLADAQDWSADPWGAEIRDGYLYGRGTIDMKNQTAAEAVAIARLAKHPNFKGTLKLIAVSDEETGGVLGAKWITEERPDLSRVDYLLNEGGGAVMPYGDRRLYGVCVAEKGTFRFNVRTAGVAAHASVPGLAENALVKLAPLITQLAERRPSYDLMEATSALLEGLGEDPEDPKRALENVSRINARLAPLLDAAMRVTFAPTLVSAGEKINVIPARAQVRVDCRVPPEMGQDVALKRVKEVLGENGYELEFTEAITGNRSPVDSPLMDAIAAWVGENDQGAQAVPTVLPAFTDSRWFRAAFPDCVAYGFFPQRHQTLYETWPMMHAKDERIDVRDLGFAAAFFHDLPGRLLAGS
jgi:acetylornithine deacetylase/succinyl-diaminopimelate desuccinylase-like protein